jgi:hypothetical protein
VTKVDERPVGFAPFQLMTREQRKDWYEIKDETGKVVGYRDLPKRDGERRWLCAPFVGPLIARLSRGALAWCNAAATTLRGMIFVDTGYVFGERSIPRWIRREHKRGKLKHKRIPPGAYFAKTRRWTQNGTQINRYPNEGERRETLWRARNERRKQRALRRKQLEQEKEERRRLGREQRRRQEAASDLVRRTPPAAGPSRRTIVVDPALAEATREHVAQALSMIRNPPAPRELGGAPPARRLAPPRPEPTRGDVHDWDGPPAEYEDDD